MCDLQMQRKRLYRVVCLFVFASDDVGGNSCVRTLSVGTLFMKRGMRRLSSSSRFSPEAA
jgi:hypothetical protein